VGIEEGLYWGEEEKLLRRRPRLKLDRRIERKHDNLRNKKK